MNPLPITFKDYSFFFVSSHLECEFRIGAQGNTLHGTPSFIFIKSNTKPTCSFLCFYSGLKRQLNGSFFGSPVNSRFFYEKDFGPRTSCNPAARLKKKKIKKLELF